MVEKLLTEQIAHQQSQTIDGNSLWGYVAGYPEITTKNFINYQNSPILILNQGLKDIYVQDAIEANFANSYIDITYLIFIHIPPYEEGQLRNDILSIRNKLIRRFFETLADKKNQSNTPNAFTYNTGRYYIPNEGGGGHRQMINLDWRSVMDSSDVSFLRSGDNKIFTNWYQLKATVTYWVNNNIGIN